MKLLNYIAITANLFSPTIAFVQSTFWIVKQNFYEKDYQNMTNSNNFNTLNPLLLVHIAVTLQPEIRINE
jgi:hypothetical protein